MAFLSIQTINMQNDLDGHAFEANKKINSNLTQLSNEIKLLPESIVDLSGEKLSLLKYLSQINETIYKNSLLLGFDYPKYEEDITFAFNTLEKVYEPINKYFISIVK
ncbi:hypothetical protein [Acinetobacter pittii]|uniref:hypothetical protein n=1 Tax=Acinetobacter pittii TaxID=48296 RepID=UPI000C1509CA|nr:hypothetical protein [Acinetobacter pittii]